MKVLIINYNLKCKYITAQYYYNTREFQKLVMEE